MRQVVQFSVASRTTVPSDGLSKSARGCEECIVNTTQAPRVRKANYSATVVERSTTAVTAAAAAAAAAAAMSVVKLPCEAMSVDGCRTATHVVYR